MIDKTNQYNFNYLDLQLFNDFILHQKELFSNAKKLNYQ